MTRDCFECGEDLPERRIALCKSCTDALLEALEDELEAVERGRSA